MYFAVPKPSTTHTYLLYLIFYKLNHSNIFDCTSLLYNVALVKNEYAIWKISVNISQKDVECATNSVSCPRSSFVGRECSAASAAAAAVAGQQTQKDAETAINFPTPSVVRLSPPLWSVGRYRNEGTL